MEVSTIQTDFFPKIEDGEAFQEIVPHSPVKGPASSARVILLKKRKSLEKVLLLKSVDEVITQRPNPNRPSQLDALLAVKLDPAVLEAQVAQMKGDEHTPTQGAEVVDIGTNKDERCYPSYEEVLLMQQAALLGLTQQQLMLLMVFVDTLRRQRQHTQRHMECAFCKKNGAPAWWYTSHALRDRRRARCPVLRALRCPRCGATGDRAHTQTYCPLNIFSDPWSFP